MIPIGILSLVAFLGGLALVFRYYCLPRSRPIQAQIWRKVSQSYTTPARSSTPLHSVIQHAVKVFEKQRQQKYQFAVLFLSSETNITRRIQYRTKDGIVDLCKTTDREHPTFPLDEDLYNYITARPDGGDHAEDLIMNKFYSLLRNYLKKQSCRSIILYTWLLPCKRCTHRIKQRLGPYAKKHNITVVYTCEGEEGVHPELIEEELSLSGITLKQETYDEYLEEAQLHSLHESLSDGDR